MSAYECGVEMNLNEFDNYVEDDKDAYYRFSEDGVQMCHSVHFTSKIRFNVAKEQEKIAVTQSCNGTLKSPEDIILMINEFLGLIEMTGNGFKLNLKGKEPSESTYNDITDRYNLKDPADIVWLKFTTDKRLGVVAVSNDVNFNYPPSKSDYNSKTDGDWTYNTSGIIIHSLEKEWDTDFVVIFPLQNIPERYSRHKIEKAIGNYLIENEVPILDYYSHIY